MKAALAILALSTVALQAQKVVEKPRPPTLLVTREDVDKALKRAPALVEFEMSYRAIESLEGQSQWHIGDTKWWVRLHNAGNTAMEHVEKDKSYTVMGYAMEQNYGVIEVWLKKIEYKK